MILLKLVFCGHMVHTVSSGYHFNVTDNVFVWRNKQQTIPKLWAEYTKYALQKCLSETFSGERSVLDFRFLSFRCFRQLHLVHRNCVHNQVGKFKQQKSRRFPVCLMSPQDGREPVSTLSTCRMKRYRERKHGHILCKRRRPRGTWQNYKILVADILTKPLGQECSSVHYKGGFKALMMNSNSKVQTGFDKLRYQFQTTRNFGLKITFRTFLLSSICYASFPFVPEALKHLFPGCNFHKGTEYVFISQLQMKEEEVLYFCFKRPQWSAYTKHIVSIEYSICNICVNSKSTFVYDYQVIDRDVLLTKKDDFRKIMFGALYKSLTCILVYNYCKRNVFSVSLQN